ncbi:MAG: hypothetical protein H6807_16750 [Planctomycetes bacterium]|nr:hypothetical protein [Planctomycetota bacterium]
MSQQQNYSITPDFWKKLAEIRSLSRLVLVALEEENVEEVERLSRDSERLMAEIRPTVEARGQAAERNEDDLLLRELLGELATMNQRILEELDLRREAVRAELGRVREGKLKLVHYRSSREREPEMLDISR